jgi:hypothetical protein
VVFRQSATPEALSKGDRAGGSGHFLCQLDTIQKFFQFNAHFVKWRTANNAFLSVMTDFKIIAKLTVWYLLW